MRRFLLLVIVIAVAWTLVHRTRAVAPRHVGPVTVVTEFAKSGFPFFSDDEPKPPKPPTIRVRHPEDPDRLVWTAKVHGDFLPTVAAWDSAYDAAGARMARDLNLSSPPDAEFIRKYVQSDCKVEKAPADPVLGDAIRVWLDLELRPDAWQLVAAKERRYLSGQRQKMLARGLAVATVLLGVIACYFRLDDWTKGYYSGRLKVLAVLVTAAVGAGIAMV